MFYKYTIIIFVILIIIIIGTIFFTSFSEQNKEYYDNENDKNKKLTLEEYNLAVSENKIAVDAADIIYNKALKAKTEAEYTLSLIHI